MFTTTPPSSPPPPTPVSLFQTSLQPHFPPPPLYLWTSALHFIFDTHHPMDGYPPQVSASADGSARLYHTLTGVCQHTLVGHEGEISKVAFNPQVGQGGRGREREGQGGREGREEEEEEMDGVGVAGAQGLSFHALTHPPIHPHSHTHPSTHTPHAHTPHTPHRAPGSSRPPRTRPAACGTATPGSACRWGGGCEYQSKRRHSKLKRAEHRHRGREGAGAEGGLRGWGGGVRCGMWRGGIWRGAGSAAALPLCWPPPLSDW